MGSVGLPYCSSYPARNVLSSRILYAWFVFIFCMQLRHASSEAKPNTARSRLGESHGASAMRLWTYIIGESIVGSQCLPQVHDPFPRDVLQIAQFR